MNCCRETAKMVVPPGNRPAVPRDWFRGVPERYVAGTDIRGRQEERLYPWSQQVIHEISGLVDLKLCRLSKPLATLNSTIVCAAVQANPANEKSLVWLGPDLLGLCPPLRGQG